MEETKEEDIARLLESAGLEVDVATVDPVSLQALQQYLSSNNYNNDANPSSSSLSSDADTETTKSTTSKESVIVPHVDESENNLPEENVQEESTLPSESNDSVTQALREQAKAIAALQNQLVALQETVKQLRSELDEQRPRVPEEGVTLQQFMSAYNGSNRSDENIQPQQPQQQPRVVRIQPRFAVQQQNDHANATVFAQMDELYNRWRNTRLAKILRLFLALRRRQVRDLDMGLIVKVAIFAAIMSSRWERSPFLRRMGVAPTHVVTVAVTIALIFKTRYAQFLYRFFVKNNYAERIWNGEEINEQDAINDENIDEPPPRPVVAAPQDGTNNMQQQQRQQGAPDGIIRVVQDVGYLFGSFFLSIFPMWQAENAIPNAANNVADGINNDNVVNNDGIVDNQDENE